MKKVYDKLIRDQIPEIIEKNGHTVKIRVLSFEEYTDALEKKLTEETEEYLNSKEPIELADILEVIDAIAQNQGISFEELLALKGEKQKNNGGFIKKLYLESTEDNIPPTYSDDIISDFTDPRFQKAFQQYFSELRIKVKDWDQLFQGMNEDGGNEAVVRTAENGNVIGFIQYKPIRFTSWFFEEVTGLIREFWVSEEYRNNGHGAALLQTAEERFREQGIRTIILTTDTAEHFYLHHGYQKAPACKAKNEDEVFIKHLI